MDKKKERRGSRIKQGTKVPVLTAEEAVALIRDGDVVCFGGTGGGIAEPTELIEALAKRYQDAKEPKNLIFYHTTGLGDRKEKGMSPLAQPGLVKRAIGAHWDQSPRLAQMAARNEIEAYNFPMGIMSQLYRAAAAGQPGLFSKTGLGTFIDPRQQGGRLNEITKEELVELKEVGGEEYLFYPSVFPDVALIRGTTADTEGYLSMEDEVAYIDNLAQAMAVHNNGGLVIAQVQRVVKNRSLHPKSIHVPGYLIDALVVVPDQPQLYGAPVNRFMSGDCLLYTSRHHGDAVGAGRADRLSDSASSHRACGEICLAVCGQRLRAPRHDGPGADRKPGRELVPEKPPVRRSGAFYRLHRTGRRGRSKAFYVRDSVSVRRHQLCGDHDWGLWFCGGSVPDPGYSSEHRDEAGCGEGAAGF